MTAVAYEVRVGSSTASSQAGRSDCVLLSLTATLGMDGTGGHATVTLAASGAAPPSPGDALTIALDGGAGMTKVFTGDVLSIRMSPDTITLAAADGLTRLARLDIDGTWEKTRAGAIAKEVAQKAGVTPGHVEDGPELPSYVLLRGPRALRHLQRLAEACGFDLFTDGEGKLCFEQPRSGAADHKLDYSTQVTALELAHATPACDGVEVYGEGAASLKGSDKAHWLVTDLASVSGKAAIDDTGAVQPGSDGKRPVTIRDGAVRSGEDAADQAAARAGAMAARRLRGVAVVLGNPAVKPGDLVAFQGVPSAHAVSTLASDAVLRVREVRHTLGARGGLLTRMEF